VSIFEAIILGMVQGLTEFLPVSSSGHLVLFNNILKTQGDFVFFSIAVHVATLLAVIIVLRKQVWALIKKPFGKQACFIYLATIPAVLVGLLLNDFIESTFGGNFYIFGFMLTAIILLLGEFIKPKQKMVATDSLQINENGTIAKKQKALIGIKQSWLTNESNFRTSITMGLSQAFAIFPGISRSGTTITAGRLAGLKKEEAANFSFLMSIPIILGALLLEIIKLIRAGGAVSIEIMPTVFGFVSSFVFGLFAITFMLKLIKKYSFKPFVIYLVLLSVVLSVLGFVGVM
jgi:undecaprenyl-diphosphatase